jgi:ABC-type branched-subunit amino acid transport system permease subunit
VFYREAGQYKTTYQADMSIFPILQDRIGLALIMVAALVLPLFAGEFMIASVMVPFLILALASIGLNILTGYTGLVSLGTGAFMGVGAYACYKLSTAFPAINILVWIVLSGFVSCAVGVLFGLPSLRIKGFYLAVATLAAQFFLQWCFVRRQGPSKSQAVPCSASMSRARRRRRRPAITSLLLSSLLSPGSCPTWCTAASAAPSWRCAIWTSPPS